MVTLTPVLEQLTSDAIFHSDIAFFMQVNNQMPLLITKMLRHLDF